MLQNQNYEAFLWSVSLHILRISPYFTVEILVWSFKFFKYFVSHHDAGCHDNKKEKQLLISPWQKHINNLLISRNWPQCVSCIYLMARGHTVLSSKLNIEVSYTGPILKNNLALYIILYFIWWSLAMILQIILVHCKLFRQSIWSVYNGKI